MGDESFDFTPDAALDEVQAGPSWQRGNWPLVGGDAEDDWTQGLDPTVLKAEIKKAAAKGGAPIDQSRIDEAAADAIRAMMLIRTYRVRGHLAADLDPLGLNQRKLPADLTPEYHGFAGAAQDRKVYVGGALGLEWTTVREIVQILRANYCGKVGLEYMHISDTEERRFLQDRMEGANKEIEFTPEGKKAILAAVVRGEQYEKFLGKKYVGTKRFGLDGGESMIPALEAVIKYGGQLGVKEIVYGMAHRGRLNVLANVMAKPYKVIFHEFSGGTANPEDVGGSGDVKYHLGTSTDREFDGTKVHMSLMPNPSHLETVDPVVLGKVRAYQQIADDIGDDVGPNAKHKQVLPVLIHGDAAFAGQGIIWECFGLSGVKGYNTGGCVHFIINNQIGFTTSPQFARNSPYPSDVAKGVQAPILHVNGDDPAAVTFACKLAIDYRQTFGRDIVIDMWCYRRFGHNEGDEPGFTQPLMYQKIRQHPPVSKIYSDKLKSEGVIDDAFLTQTEAAFTEHLEEQFEAAKTYKANQADWFSGQWSGFHKPADPETARRNVDTKVEPKLFESLGRTLTTVPADLTVHKTLARVLAAKEEMFKSGEGFDWATAEALAFGSLVSEGYGVRLSGQDCGRGTFSQRHAVWTDQTDERKYVPLTTLPHGRFEVLDSTLSEYGVLGFEYGFASADPKTLVLWEAQFGDFANGAQIIIDQYVASAESKWLRANGLVMLLPHGYEGQGPEHSSARLERYLQLCAQDNIQVCNITSPANYFHVLRRQMRRPFRKPLVIMTPKSLLRHPLAKSSAKEFLEGDFKRILSDPKGSADEATKKVVLCSGKVFYDLLEARDAAEIDDTQIIRIEQLYPFPGEPLAKRLSKMPNLEEIVWCQEEPKNNGSWFFVEPLVEAAAVEAGVKAPRPRYAGRSASASPATGLAKRHTAEQAALVADALHLSVRSELRRKQKA
ncbi:MULTISPECIES: 2-oxoglutarate dehydrogenase E1 component [Sphingomonadaceae]|jgi:2-oxoglutarate dehydrogenase E1 component|uniref:2-oxoglutarate dehydrogenase E1 component n=1 Tax=Novosphingobium resinovorum TaxID=158500 RepID=A0A031JVM6_9SPHN|nr:MULTISPECIES: 2-oxoglutarate dehydrogenase E1 component [Sphingomonadaceae]AOR76879.1 2-oxoglutarate dehydrogenase E1 component [Novosphingobium resinovorum]EJU10244.1 2-oxoglutarate dehydrogenase E1 component [Sphingomonas sp. LH128]EZP80427.1 MFS transporter [Novosphingobium resinovorum]MBF7012246.1 2-oxoglutarate dehydrogenase E1 component [Novosphingobium sp. HR1a]MEE4450684.1 2-oxoglutarate dehydrogenase E1 component [Novosphingobium resinovorum]